MSAVATVVGLQLAIVTGIQWSILVDNWGDTEIWKQLPWTGGIAPFMSALSKYSEPLSSRTDYFNLFVLDGILVQLFFVR